MVVNPNTGLPELPERYFWNVSLPEYDLVRIELCQYTGKSNLFGKPKFKIISWSVVESLRISEVAIANEALFILNHNHNPWTDPILDARKFAGRYPPKKLGNNNA